jgi:hypothetical protein
LVPEAGKEPPGRAVRREHRPWGRHQVTLFVVLASSQPTSIGGASRMAERHIVRNDVLPPTSIGKSQVMQSDSRWFTRWAGYVASG